MQRKEVRQVADGMLAKVKAKPSMERLASNIAREQAVVTAMSGKITRTMRDKPPVSATYKMRMNQFVAPHVGLRGPDSQTNAYVKPTAAEGKALFSSKYVPFTDGTELLTGANKRLMSQYGYGNVPCSSLPSAPKTKRIGFNNTLVDTSGGKLTVCMAEVRKYPNTAVYTDFPKGPGGASPNKMWVDGTYEETLAAIHKKQDERTKDLDLKMPTDIRRKVFDQQALVGNQVYGNELLKQNIEDEFAQERAQRAIQAARAARPGATRAELQTLGEDLLSTARAGRIERQLRLPSGSPVALQAARDELRAERQQRERGREVQQNVARQEAQRVAAQEEARVENQRRRIRARERVQQVLGELPRAALLERVARSKPLRTFPLLGERLVRILEDLPLETRIGQHFQTHNQETLRNIRGAAARQAAEAAAFGSPIEAPMRLTGAGRRRRQATEAEIAAAVAAEAPVASAAKGGAGGPITISVPSEFARDLGRGAEADKAFLASMKK